MLQKATGLSSTTKLILLTVILPLTFSLVGTGGIGGIRAAAAAPSGQSTLGHVVMNGTSYTVVEETTMSPVALRGVEPSITSQIHVRYVSDFQYGLSIGDSYGYYGAQINTTYFDGQGNAGWLSQWIGATDNTGFFYQAGVAYWPGCSPYYTIWAVDNYPNGGNNGLGVGCPAPNRNGQYNYHAVDSAAQWLNSLMYVYNGQWYYCFTDGTGMQNCGPFPNGSDGGKTVGSYGGVAGAADVTEGDDTSSYSDGTSNVSDLAYVSDISVQGTTLVLDITFTSSLEFTNTGGSDAPPSTANFAPLPGNCPGLYSSYFESGGPGIPSYGSPISPCPSSSTTISPSLPTVAIGAAITLQATVTDTSSGTETSPAGSVSWSDGGRGGSFSDPSCVLSSSGSTTGVCSATYTPPSSAGSETITASYSGDSAHAKSSGSVPLTVSKRVTATTSSPKSSSVVPGKPITLTVVVSDTGGGTPSSPTGTVSWKASISGGTFNSVSCTLATISSTQSHCSVTYTAPSRKGTVTITAKYNGDSTHATSSGTSKLKVT